MAVKIRLTRLGSKKNAHYRVVVIDSHSPRDGKSIETIGRYVPQADPSVVEIDTERARAWLAKGAQPSASPSRSSSKSQGSEIRDLVEYLVRLLASKPEAVVVEETMDAEGRHVSVRVDAEDVGRLIGRGGRTVRALRTVARAAAGSGERVTLEIRDAE